MKHRFIAVTPLMTLLAAALLIVACGGSDSGTATPTAASAVVDLSSAGAQLSITLPPGDVQPGAPSLVASGDFNGDGKADLLIGAPFSDGPNAARPDAGEAYVLYGPISGQIDLTQSEPDVRIFGAVSGDSLGGGVAAGDINGDGIDDIIVGAPLSNGLANVRTDSGEAYVIFGRSNLPQTIDTASVQQDFDLLPAEGFSHLGQTFAVGDVNGDGIADLVAGAPYAGREPNTPPGGQRTTVGEVYVVYGSHDLHGQALVGKDEENVRLSGVTAYDQFGSSVAVADVNGDGAGDIIIGANGYDGPAGDRTDAGGAFIFYGGASLPAYAQLTSANVAITGADAGDNFGTLVASADLNGDGKAEVVASSPLANGPGNKRYTAGEVTIVDVAHAGAAAIDVSTAGGIARIFGPQTGEFAPSSLAASSGSSARIVLGDVNHGLPDRSASGATYVVHTSGSQDTDLANDNQAQLDVLGAASGDGFGGSVAMADISGDGVPDLIVEATGSAGTAGPDPNFRARIYAIKLS